MSLRRALSDRRGAGAVEFALAAPVFFALVVGIAQLGTVYLAKAGLKHAVDEAARAASIWPAPTTNAPLLAAIQRTRFGMRGNLTPTVVFGTAADGMAVVDINLNYAMPLNFVFFQRSVTLTHNRRVFLHTAATTPPPGAATPPATPPPATPPPATTPPATGGGNNGNGNNGNGNNGNGNNGNGNGKN